MSARYSRERSDGENRSAVPYQDDEIRTVRVEKTDAEIAQSGRCKAAKCRR
jgi:hypothetical protein